MNTAQSQTFPLQTQSLKATKHRVQVRMTVGLRDATLALDCSQLTFLSKSDRHRELLVVLSLEVNE
jgi:hypothetical protein